MLGRYAVKLELKKNISFDFKQLRHGPFDIQGAGGLVRAKIFFSDKTGARLFFSPV